MNKSISVAVASQNPVKLDAVNSGFVQVFSDSIINTNGYAVDSLVSDQPIGCDVTLRGAENRAMAVRESCPDCEFAVGVEGGIELINDQMFGFAWIVVIRQMTSRAKSANFPLPPAVQRLVEAGDELGVANDRVFAQHNSKQKGGAVGLLTGNLIDRKQLYQHAVILSLIPHLNVGGLFE